MEEGGEGVEGIASTTAILKNQKNEHPEKQRYRYANLNRLSNG